MFEDLDLGLGIGKPIFDVLGIGNEPDGELVGIETRSGLEIGPSNHLDRAVVHSEIESSRDRDYLVLIDLPVLAEERGRGKWARLLTGDWAVSGFGG